MDDATELSGGRPRPALLQADLSGHLFVVTETGIQVR